MRRESQDFEAIVPTALLAGAAMGGGSALLFSGIMLGDGPSLMALAAIAGLVGGAILGLCSLAYLYPTLRGTRLRSSLPLVFGVSVPVGLLGGAVHPFLGAGGAMFAQIGTCVYATVLFRRPKDGGRFTCETCGYSLRGIMPDFCPECGGPWLDMPRRVEGICPACRQIAELSAARPRCPHCGAIDLELALGSGSTS